MFQNMFNESSKHKMELLFLSVLNTKSPFDGNNSEKIKHALNRYIIL